MSTKQRLLFITTGGTIASVRTQQGLKPVLTSEELLAHLPELNELCCPDTLALCSIDSTDLGPEHWLMMAKAVQENYALYDGFIICHGTDTLAYSAAALSYLHNVKALWQHRRRRRRLQVPFLHCRRLHDGGVAVAYLAFAGIACDTA